MDHVVVSNGEIVSHPSTRRRKWLTRTLTVLVGLGAILAAMWNATPAHADTNSYLARLASAGYTGPVMKWTNLGYDVCQLQAAGVPIILIANKIVATTGSGIYTADAYEIIGIANDELCYSSGAFAT